MSKKNDPFEKLRKKVRSSSQQNNYSTFSDDEKDDQFISSSEIIQQEDISDVESEEHFSESIEKNKNNNEVNTVDQLEYVFFPKPDITTYDLARILAFTQLSISEDLYQKFPPELKKFFAKFEEIQSM